MKKIIRIYCCLLVICFIGGGSVFSAENNTTELSWQQAVPMQINAKFRHGNIKPKYESNWNGVINALISVNNDKSLRLQLRTGIGKRPCRLFADWAPLGEQKSLGTAQVPICLAAARISEQMLNRWIKAENNQNPALSVALVPIPNAPASFTNPTAVNGQVFVWDSSGKAPTFIRYAEIIIPAGGLTLNLSDAPKNMNTNSNAPLLGMNIKGAILQKVSQRAWNSILANGNLHLKLARVALPGRSSEFSGVTEQNNNAVDTLKCVRDILNSLEGIYIANLIPEDVIQYLIDSVDDAGIGLNLREHATAEKQAAYAFSRLVGFEKKIKQIGANSGLTAGDSAFLLAQSNALLMHMIAKAKPAFSLVQVMPMLPGEPRTWYVNQRLNCPTPDGSEEFPFPSIASALEEAARQNLSGVTLFISSGVYREALEITRDTAIVAVAAELPVITESITNSSNATLSICGIHLIGAGSPAAVWVKNNSAHTVLSDVLIYSADDFGIYQEGGYLQLENVSVSRTHANPGPDSFGSGIMVARNAQAELDNVVSEDNESHGLLVDGVGAYVYADGITIQGNDFNRNWEDEYVARTLVGGTGALEVRDFAGVDLRNVTVRDNEIDGVLVHSNAIAVIMGAVIERTRAFIPSGGWPDDNFGGGIGVRARLNGHLIMGDFIISNCALVGVVIGEAGAIDLSIGEVSHNPVGVHLAAAGFDISRLMDRVLYVDNGINLDAEFLPVPGSDF